MSLYPRTTGWNRHWNRRCVSFSSEHYHELLQLPGVDREQREQDHRYHAHFPEVTRATYSSGMITSESGKYGFLLGSATSSLRKSLNSPFLLSLSTQWDKQHYQWVGPLVRIKLCDAITVNGIEHFQYPGGLSFLTTTVLLLPTSPSHTEMLRPLWEDKKEKPNCCI